MGSALGHKFERTTIITWACGAFLVGLLLGRHGAAPFMFLAFSVVLSAVCLPRRKIIALIAVCLLGVALGVMRGQAMFQRTQEYERLFGKDVILLAEAQSDAVYADNGQLEFDGGSITLVAPFEQKLPGTIRVQGYGENAVSRGDILELRGKLFPTGGSRQAKFSYGQIKTIYPDASTPERIRKEFVAGMFSAVPEPQASFGLGLLIGQRTTLPDYLLDALSVAGLTHIIAVSGYNLTIIVRIMRRLLGKRSKYQAFMFSLLLIGAFIFVTGFSASIVRAAVVSFLSLLAWYYGRHIKPMLLLLLSAAITAGWNPIYIWSDIGWHLSFLAFFGVLVLAPLIKQRLYGDKEQKLLGQVVLESVCAQIMAAPLILYVFGEVSLVAIVSNAIIVPLVPLAMLFSLFAGLAGMFVPAISGIIALPATLLLTYMLDLVQVFAHVPNALLKTVTSSFETMYMYALLGLVTLLLHYALKRKYGRITERNIIE